MFSTKKSYPIKHQVYCDFCDGPHIFVSFSRTRGEAALGSEPQPESGLGFGLGWVDGLSRFDENKPQKHENQPKNLY